MNDIVFTPKHNWTLRTLSAVIMFASVGWLTWLGNHSLKLSLLVSGGLIILLFLLVFVEPRLITFREKEIVVIRPPLSNLVLTYEAFTGMDNEMIRFGSKGIALTFLANSKELQSLVSRLIEDGIIVRHPLRLFDWWLTFKAFRISWFVSFVVTFVSFLVASEYFYFRLNMFAVLFLLFFVLFSISYFFLKRSEE